MKKSKFPKLLSILLAVFITIFTTGLKVQAGKPGGGNTGPTTISGAETDTTGYKVILAFDKAMQSPSGKQSSFKVNINSTNVQTPTQASPVATDSTKINLTLSTPVKFGDIVTVSYNPSSSKMALKSTDGAVLTPFTNSQVTNKVPEPIFQTVTYVSLGDSIATGKTGTGSTTSFPTLFRNYLQNTYYPGLNAGTNITTNVHLLQHAINGQTSNELLDILTYSGTADLNYDAAMVDDVKKGNIITLSIGGNDLMQWATIPGFTSVDWAQAEISANDFVNSTWTQLIDVLKTLMNPTAKLIVTTGYNPYNLQGIPGYESDVAKTTADYSFSGKTESLVTQMRSAVLNYAVNTAGARRYEIADVYADFHDNYGQTSMGQITLFYPYFLGLATPTLRDPHPNQTGQNRINNLIKAYFPAQ